MTKQETIRACREHLYNANLFLESGDHTKYSQHMQHCLDLLLEELGSRLPIAQTRKEVNP